MKRYDLVTDPTTNGLCEVMLNGKFGIYNSFDSIEVIEPIYEQIRILDDNLFEAKHNGVLGLVTCDKKILFSSNIKSITDFDDNHCLIHLFTMKYMLVNKKTGKISTKEYTHINQFVNSYSIVSKDSKYGVINQELEEVIPTKFESVHQLKDNLFFVEILKTKYIIDVNNSSQKIVDYTHLFKVDDNLPYLLVCKDHLWGIVDDNLQEVVPIGNNYFIYKENGIFIVSKNDKLGLFSVHKKEFILPICYERIILLGHDLYAVQKDTLNFALFNSSGVQLTEFKYSKLECISDHIIKATVKNYKSGLLDFNGNEVIAPLYDDVTCLNSGYVLKKDGQYGICNSYFILVSKMIYDEVRSIHENILIGNCAKVVINGVEGSYYW